MRMLWKEERGVHSYPAGWTTQVGDRMETVGKTQSTQSAGLGDFKPKSFTSGGSLSSSKMPSDQRARRKISKPAWPSRLP